MYSVYVSFVAMFVVLSIMLLYVVDTKYGMITTKHSCVLVPVFAIALLCIYFAK